jgi:hypothetical protein
MLAVNQQMIIHFSMEMGMLITRIRSEVKGHWSDIILNVHAATEDKSDDKRAAFTSNWSMYVVNSQSTT